LSVPGLSGTGGKWHVALAQRGKRIKRAAPANAAVALSHVAGAEHDADEQQRREWERKRVAGRDVRHARVVGAERNDRGESGAVAGPSKRPVGGEQADDGRHHADEEQAHGNEQRHRRIVQAGVGVFDQAAHQSRQAFLPAHGDLVGGPDHVAGKASLFQAAAQFHVVGHFERASAVRADGLVRRPTDQVEAADAQVVGHLGVADVPGTESDEEQEAEAQTEGVFPEAAQVEAEKRDEVVQFFALGKGDSAAQRVGREHDVRVGEEYPLAPACVRALPQRVRFAQPAGGQVANVERHGTLVRGERALGEAIQEGARRVRAPVVHANDFEAAGIVLRPERVERAGQFLLLVAGGEDNRQRWGVFVRGEGRRLVQTFGAAGAQRVVEASAAQPSASRPPATLTANRAREERKMGTATVYPATLFRRQTRCGSGYAVRR
jgi:hypothetical protein